MQSRPLNRTRRALLARTTELTGLAALTAVTYRRVSAAEKAAKGDFLYRDHRHDGKSCDQCRFFTPDGPSSETGSCSIIAGAVKREGWCTAFAPKVLA
jgi:hypothetical protein